MRSSVAVTSWHGAYPTRCDCWAPGPDDIALVGFDNREPMALGADPPLTSIDMCLEDVGRKAAELLLAPIDGEPAHGLTTVPSRLITRASSGHTPRRPSHPRVPADSPRHS